MPRGWHTNCGRFTNKKIGVNKLGTLLSSQTTGAPGNHATTLLGRPATLRSNFSNLPDPRVAPQIRRQPANPRYAPPPRSNGLGAQRNRTPEGEVVWWVSPQVPGLSGRSPSRRLRKQYTGFGQTPNRGCPRGKTPPNRPTTPLSAPRTARFPESVQGDGRHRNDLPSGAAAAGKFADPGPRVQVYRFRKAGSGPAGICGWLWGHNDWSRSWKPGVRGAFIGFPSG